MSCRAGRSGVGALLLSMDGVRALFLDRDGVVNCCPGDGYVRTPGEFRFMPGIFPLMCWAAAQGWKLVLVTNQQGVGKGIMSAGDLDAIHRKMQSDLAREAVPFDAVYACTHLAGTCDCRKPSPVMIARACREHGIWRSDLCSLVMLTGTLRWRGMPGWAWPCACSVAGSRKKQPTSGCTRWGKRSTGCAGGSGREDLRGYPDGFALALGEALPEVAAPLKHY